MHPASFGAFLGNVFNFWSRLTRNFWKVRKQKLLYFLFRSGFIPRDFLILGSPRRYWYFFRAEKATFWPFSLTKKWISLRGTQVGGHKVWWEGIYVLGMIYKSGPSQWAQCLLPFFSKRTQPFQEKFIYSSIFLENENFVCKKSKKISKTVCPFFKVCGRAWISPPKNWIFH